MLTKKRHGLHRQMASALALVLLFSLFAAPLQQTALGLDAPENPVADIAETEAAPAEIPEEAPAEEAPVEIPEEAPAEEAPAEIPEEAPEEEAPAEIPEEAPEDETPEGFPEDLPIQAAPTADVWVNIYRNVSGAAPVYTQVLTLAELASLTSIDASSYYLASGISAAWTLDTAQPGAAQSQSVSVASIAGNAVNFYFNAPSGSWTGVESVANPVNPQVTGQSVVVYTYAAFKAALQSAAYSYIEFGANLSYIGSSNTDATITIAPNRAGPELTLNAKGYEFRTNRTGNNVIRFAGTTTGSNLTQVVYQDWNVPELRSAYGLFYGSSTRVVTLVFDGLTFAGPQLADLSANSHLTLDGTRSPVDITITRPGNTGDTASEVVDAGNNLVFQGQVSVTRENVTGTTSLFTGFEFVTVGADADVFVEDKRASGVFCNGAPALVLESGASFTYRGNRQFSSSSLGSLTIGEDATFDLRTSGAIASIGLLRVAGNLTIGNNAAFLVVSESNRSSSTATSTLPVIYTTGNISITNPRALLVYQSSPNAAASSRVWNFTASGRSFSYTGKGLARWDTVLGDALPADGNYSEPNKFWANWDGSPLTITGTTATGGAFGSSLTVSGYDNSGHAVNNTEFSFNTKVIADLDTAGAGRYAIEYLLQTPNEVGPPTETPMDLPTYQNYSWPGQTIHIPFPPATGFRRVDDQPVTAPHAPGRRTFYAYYEPLNISMNPIELEKSAVRLEDNEWEVTLTINSDSETYTPTVDLDIMLTLDRSGSMSAARRAAVKNAAITMVDALSANGKLVGRIRMGVVSFGTTARLDLPLTDIRNAGAASSSGVAAVKAAVSTVYDVVGSGSTYMDLGIDSASAELYTSSRTSAYSTKHMVLLTDGQATSTARARASATNYRNLGGRLVTVGLGVTPAATTLLREIQNAGYYAASDGNISQVFADIADVIAAAIQSGMVVDPVGTGFEFRSITGAALPAGAVTSYVSVSQGAVTLEMRNGVQTLIWDLDGQVPENATLKYRVRLLNPNASTNAPLSTNGTTTLSYIDIEGESLSQNFDVPKVVYGVGKVTAAYGGDLPVAQRPASVVRGPVNLYPTAPPPFEFDGPQSQGIAGYLLSSFTLTGSEVINNQVVTWDLSADTLAELIALSNGRIVSLGANRYSLTAPAGDLTITYRYDTPAEYDIEYENVHLDEAGAANPNPATYNVLQTPVTLKNPTRPGYTFSGWYAYDEEKEDFVETTGIEEGGTGDRVFRAKWGDGDDWDTPDTYSIEYENVDDATNPSENPNSYTILDTPIDLEDPVRRGYTFSGWYAYDEEKEKFVETTGIEEGGTGDRVFRAKWGDGDDWETPDTYSIEYENIYMDEVGAENDNPATYTILQTPITLVDPVRR
ncbi:MAG: VWA domain-containing protein, partial [Oscillospiraceae bacterium]|nr:VWA domain-containing protein [Oscillospiraceae bacterium]